MASMTGSVGRDGQNRPEDVRNVQQLLATTPADVLPGCRIAVNGVCDRPTIAWIEEFQRRALRVASPTGRVNPGSPTFAALARLSRQPVLRQAA